MSMLRVDPASLEGPARAHAVAAELFSGAAHALRRHAVDTGRGDSGDAVSMLLRALTAEADVLARAAEADALAVRVASGTYLRAERRAMEH